MMYAVCLKSLFLFLPQPCLDQSADQRPAFGMAHNEMAQCLVKFFFLGYKNICVRKIDNRTLRFVIGRRCPALRMRMNRIPAAVEIGGQRLEISLALLALLGFLPCLLFCFTSQSDTFRFLSQTSQFGNAA
jgi:hypothetical protein